MTFIKRYVRMGVKNKQPEHELQKAVATYLDLMLLKGGERPLYSATVGGVRTTMRQAVLMKQVGGNGEAQGVASELQAIPKSLNCVFLCLHISDQNVGSLELLTAHHHCLSTMQYDLGALSRVWRTDWMKTCVKLKIARTLMSFVC